MDRDITSHFRRDSAEIFHTSKVKAYPSGAIEVTSCSRPIFRDPGYELASWDDLPAARSDSAEGRNSVGNRERAARRAAQHIRDLALSNEFSYFVTLTLDRTKIDRYDPSAVVRRLNVWLDNHVRRDGLRYVLIPELHKDGALHFHGFFNDVSGFIESGTWEIPGAKKPRRPRSKTELSEWERLGDEAGYHRVFNYEAWPFGFTTAIRLYGDYDRAISYVCKYVRKQQESGKICGRWYYSGGKLREPDVVRCDLTLTELCQTSEGVYKFDVPEIRARFGVLRIPGGGDEKSAI